MTCHCHQKCSCATVGYSCHNLGRGSSGISGIYCMAPPGLTTDNHDNRVRASLVRLTARIGRDKVREAILNFRVLPSEEQFANRTLTLLRGV